MNGIMVFLAFFGGFVVAQTLKILIAIVKNKGKVSLRELLGWAFKSGGMPSGHAASMTAATALTGWVAGWQSVEFALACCITMIVLYDAINVRYAVGEQGKVLNQMMRTSQEKVGREKQRGPLKIIEGHTVPEVVAGVWVGLLVALSIIILAQRG